MNGLTARALKAQAQAWLTAGKAACVVSVDQIKGSTPRDVGTRMLVSQDEVLGTIGGGHLEWQAIDMARAPRGQAWQHTFPLGPTLGQCCGGVVTLGFTPLTEQSLQSWPLPAPRFHLELHGAGHVGQSIANLLQQIDCTVRWIDERGEAPDSDTRAAHAGHAAVGVVSDAQLQALPTHMVWLPTDAAHMEVADAPAGCVHLILTHRHDLDLRIVHAVLKRNDAAFVGMIGSRTKDAKFRHRLRDMGLPAPTIAQLQCPIGIGDIAGKEPAVIAISVVAQLLQRFPPQPGP